MAMVQKISELDANMVATLGAECPLNELRMATRAITRIFDAFLKPTGLLATQLPILVKATTLGPITISAMATELVMDRTTLTRNLKPLERQGLIAIAQGGDRRTRVVSITPRGEALLMDVVPLWAKVQDLITQKLGEGPRRDLQSTLLAVVDLYHGALPLDQPST